VLGGPRAGCDVSSANVGTVSMFDANDPATSTFPVPDPEGVCALNPCVPDWFIAVDNPNPPVLTVEPAPTIASLVTVTSVPAMGAPIQIRNQPTAGPSWVADAPAVEVAGRFDAIFAEPIGSVLPSGIVAVTDEAITPLTTVHGPLQRAVDAHGVLALLADTLLSEVCCDFAF
jgi:hypothetical protein